MNLREIINDGIILSNLDDEIYVKICRRDQNNNVKEIALVPIRSFDPFDNLCIEEDQIEWHPYSSDSEEIKEYKTKRKHFYGKSAQSLEWIYIGYLNPKQRRRFQQDYDEDFVSFQESEKPLL